MDWTRFLEYLSKGENLSTRFLSRVKHHDDLLEIITAMANTVGGKIFVGMDLVNCHLVGSNIDAAYVDKMISHHCKPWIHVAAEEINRGGKVLLCLTVSEGQMKPYFIHDKCYVMEGPKTRIALNEEIREMQHNRPSVAPEAESFNSDNIEDDDIRQITEDLLNLKKEDASDDETLTILPLKDDVDGNSNSATSNRLEVTSNRDVSATKTSDTVVTQQKLDTISDLSTNQKGPDLESNEATVESNRSEGIDSELAPNDSGVKQPVINAQEFAFSVISNNETDGESLNDRQLNALDYLKQQEFIKNKLYRELYGVSHKTAHYELIELVERGLLKQQGQGRSTHYVLAI
jgi:predicted HTH transcriptional regulator